MIVNVRIAEKETGQSETKNMCSMKVYPPKSIAKRVTISPLFQYVFVWVLSNAFFEREAKNVSIIMHIKS